MSLTKKILSIFILSMLLIIESSAVYATPNSFNSTAANKRFDAINIKLSTQNLNKVDLEKAIIEIEALQEKAKICVDENERQLELISAAAIPNTVTPKNQDDKVSFLSKERRFYQENLTACKLFILRSKESISAFKKTLSQLSTTALLSAKTPIWNLFENNIFHTYISFID